MTPVRQFHLHFLGNGGIQLHLTMAGNYPRIPGITPGLGLVHYPLLPVMNRLALLVQSGRSASPLGVTHPRNGQHVPVPMRPHSTETGSARRPAGFLIVVDNPNGRFHRPRACAPSCQQCYKVNIDGPMQFAFANPLCLPTSRHRLTVSRCTWETVGFPPCGRPRVGHSGDWRFGWGCGPHPTVVSSAS